MIEKYIPLFEIEMNRGNYENWDGVSARDAARRKNARVLDDDGIHVLCSLNGHLYMIAHGFGENYACYICEKGDDPGDIYRREIAAERRW